MKPLSSQREVRLKHSESDRKSEEKQWATSTAAKV